MPVDPPEVKQMEFLRKSDATYSGAAIIEFSSFETLKKGMEIDGRETKGMVIWAVEDKGIHTSLYCIIYFIYFKMEFGR